jgi:multimeric flavodoxin WrbA
MKIIGIISSANNNGNTASLVREALKGASENGAEITEIFLPDYKIEFCSGCFKCMYDGKCRFSDDMESLKKILSEADGFILSSPTYMASANAMMKKFLERLGLFERLSSSLFGGKYVASISTANGAGAKKVARELASYVRDSIFKRSYVSGILAISIHGRKVTENKTTLKMAYDLGKKISLDIKTGKKYFFQNLFGRLFIEMLLKPKFKTGIENNKAGNLKAVYSILQKQGVFN